MTTAKGAFDVALDPQDDGDFNAGRMTLDKTYHGDLTATSVGQMLSVRTETPGSAGYVALEKVRGSLGGKAGSFYLQHSSTMTRGTPSQSITVVPDSGTDALIGLKGSMEIIIKDGAHFYRFDYDL